MTYLHKYYLVEAARARVLADAAWEYYEQAIDLAGENKHVNEEALVYELTGQFSLAKVMEEVVVG